jgi:hypothetical protein
MLSACFGGVKQAQAGRSCTREVSQIKALSCFEDVSKQALSSQFQLLTEPFLLIGEIENHLRRLIANSFSVEDLQSVRDEADDKRTVNKVADLNIGEYMRLLENPASWSKLNLKLDRRLFCEQLDEVRRIRNDVMHFNNDKM